MPALRNLKPPLAAVVLAAAAGLAAGCGERPGGDRPATETMMHLEDDAGRTADELLAADRAFAAEVAAAAGAERARIWAGWFAADGRQLVPRTVVTGPADILGLMAPVFADSASSLAWAPDLAAGSGGWGWTSGRYRSTRPGPDGPAPREGRYLTVWRRQPDGAWKVAMDTGVPDGD